jgi:monovalent cation/hydrogen antiporter
MHDFIIEYICFILIILGLVMLANKLRIAYPILLVLGGLAFSFTKIFAHVTINPELIFFIFLPPMLYEAAWQTSWPDFWRWRRLITSFAFPIVILTSCVVAFVSHWFIPGFTLALGFLLGGIVSPPDAISATTIMRSVKVPKVLVSVIEGESLLNDASSLIVFRFALAAVVTGQFYFASALGSFFLVIIMGTMIGLIVALIFYAIHRWLPTTPAIEIVLSFLAPYCMYYFAELFHFSGVLAVVAGGLFLSSKRQKMLSYQGRVQGANVWSTIGFVLNGIVFLLIGFQLPAIIQQLEEVSLSQAIGYGLLISFVLIIVRMACTLGAVAFTRFAGRFITVADPDPDWRPSIIFGWAGMRGVVSLAAALSIPLLINQGQPFPFRNLILVITFIVILVTLVFQGLTLPWVIRKVNPPDKYTVIPVAQQEFLIQQKIAKSSLQFLEDKYKSELDSNEHINNLHRRLEIDLTFFNQELKNLPNTSGNKLHIYHHIYLDLLEQQRKELNACRPNYDYDEEVIRKFLSLIDIEEFRVREQIVDPD